MKNYLITHKETNSEMLFKYSLKGVLTEFKLNFKPRKEFYRLLQPPFPFLITGIEPFKSDSKFRVQEIKNNLSFENFWNSFGYKFGNKKKAENVWKLLTEVQKAKAIAYIPKYKNMIINSNINHLYPETYLRQRRYEND